MASCRERRLQRVHQPRLADTGLGADQHDLAVALLDLLPGSASSAEIAAAANQLGQAGVMAVPTCAPTDARLRRGRATTAARCPEEASDQAVEVRNRRLTRLKCLSVMTTSPGAGCIAGFGGQRAGHADDDARRETLLAASTMTGAGMDTNANRQRQRRAVRNADVRDRWCSRRHLVHDRQPRRDRADARRLHAPRGKAEMETQRRHRGSDAIVTVEGQARLLRRPCGSARARAATARDRAARQGPRNQPDRRTEW